ncbi:MAG: GGDEF domain-containing protein [Spirochaetales bacterium]|nr:GGDEF domain-containing protein [Spirochaetales bacterium]
MGIINYILENYSMIYELIGLMVILGVSAHLSERMKKLTIVVVVLLLLESAIFDLERWTQSFEKLSLLRPMLTACLYSLYPLVLMILTLLTETSGTPRRSWLLVLPWLVSLPLFFFSQWTHLVAWYHEDNHFARGPLGYLPYALFLFYVVVFFVQNVRYFRSYSRMNQAASRYIVLGALVGMFLYFYFDGYKDYSAIFTSSILLYYVLVYIHMAKMDPLTSLPNRQSFYQDMVMESQNITGVISIDMNELKYLNDNLGHEAGDMALEMVSGVFRRNCPQNCTAYRVGGDEFMVICRNTSEFDIRSIIVHMREDLKQTSYICSFGYAMVNSETSIDDAIRLADSRMYENKTSIKNDMAKQGVELHTRE